MAVLFSRYFSGTQLTAGTIVGSSLGASGLNPIVDRLNSISTDNNIVTGSMISGTSTNIITPYQFNHSWTGSFISGTSTSLHISGGMTWMDHTLGSSFRLINVMIGTGSLPPISASGTPVGTIYFQYTA